MAPARAAVAGALVGRRGSVGSVGRRAREDALAEAQAALESARLELQATKLRAEAEELERQMALARRAERARQLLGESGTQTSLDLAALRQRLREEFGLDVTEERAQWLLDQCRGTGGKVTLELEDLQSEAFQAALDKLVAEEQEASRRAVLEERERALRAPRERPPEMQEILVTPDEINDDRSLGTRVLGTLAYLLPLLDGLQFGAPLVQVIPSLAPLFVALSVPNALLNAIPFGSLLFFIALTVLANNRALPRLLRFNLQQACLLDVALFLPSILASLLSMASGGSGGAGEAPMARASQ